MGYCETTLITCIELEVGSANVLHKYQVENREAYKDLPLT